MISSSKVAARAIQGSEVMCGGKVWLAETAMENPAWGLVCNLVRADMMARSLVERQKIWKEMDFLRRESPELEALVEFARAHQKAEALVDLRRTSGGRAYERATKRLLGFFTR